MACASSSIVCGRADCARTPPRSIFGPRTSRQLPRCGSGSIIVPIDLSKANSAVADVLAQMKRGKVSLLYAARDPDINHAVVLAEFLNKSR
jgi:hypothetical protein